MESFAKLELGIHHRMDEYTLEMRFWTPGSRAETWLAGKDLLEVKIDPQALLPYSHDASAYGKYLTDCVFADGDARSGFASARATAQALGAPLRLRFWVGPTAPELNGLRWETLLDPDHLTPLSTDEQILFSRYVGSSSLYPFQPATRSRLRACVLVANPSNLSKNFPALQVDEEVERARTGLGDMNLEILAGPGKATLDNLLTEMRDHRPDLLYLVAHGGIANKEGPQPYVLLEKPDSTLRPVLASELVARLRDLLHLPFLVVLISCNSAGEGSVLDSNPMIALGPRLVDCGVPAVVAMNGTIRFSTVAEFAPVFFKELQRDGQIDRAVAVARSHVRDSADWWAPVLFSRLDDHCLFNPEPPDAKALAYLFEPETVYVSAGKFWMGCQPGPGVLPWESPTYEVDLPAFRIGKYPVTHQQFSEFIRQTGQLANIELGWDGQMPPEHLVDKPVTGVSWVKAMEYCLWLSEKTGKSYTLPNEAQWEKAARGVKGWIYPWGNEWLQVAELPPSPFDCYGMVGGVREWTVSLWGEKRAQPDRRYIYPWQEDGRNDPLANLQIRRVFRGGSSDDPFRMTCTARGSSAPDQTGIPGKRFGFRVVMKLQEGDAGDSQS